MFNFKNLKKLNPGYNVFLINDFLEKKICKNIYHEIIQFKNFDDKVMHSRNRINKGSKNFANFIKSSKYSSLLYKNLNTFKFYKKLYKMLDVQNSGWFINNKFKLFSKKNFGSQKSSFADYYKKFFFIDKFKKTCLNLDIDFSLSEYGYYRGPHRDRDTRIISFLIYFNNIDKKYGGSFDIYKFSKISKIDKFPQFPENKQIKLFKKIYPKAGQLVVFLSSPNSYHSAQKFLSKFKKRVFVYGSFSLNKKVDWKFN